MRVIPFFLAVGLISALSGPARAETTWRFLTFSGDVRAGALFDRDGDTDYLLGDFTIVAAGEAVGAELGAFGAVGGLHETYVALTWAISERGKLSVGNPRPAYDLFAVAGLDKAMPRLALEAIGNSRSRATFGTMSQSGFLPFGASYQHDSGALSYALSLHAVADANVAITGAGAAYRYGNFTYSGSIEFVSQNNAIDANAKAQISAEKNDLSGSISYFKPDANGLPDVFELGFGFHFAPSWDFLGVYVVPVGGNAKTTAALTTHYNASDNLGFDLGVADEGSAYLTWNAGLVWAF